MTHGDLEKHGCEMHTDMPADEYHKADGLSKSMMAKLIDSPAHLRHYLDTPQEPNEAFVFGQAFEDALQRPNEFYREYIGTDKWSSYCKSLIKAQADEEKILIPQEWFTTINNMVNSVKQHPIAGKLIANTVHKQSSIFWYDDETGQKCKARLDTLCGIDGKMTHVDIKTAKSADPFWFQRDAVDYSYYLQAAHYTIAFDQVWTKVCQEPYVARDFRFLVVEKTPDIGDIHRVEVFHYHPHDLIFAMEQRERLIRLYQKCVKANEWPYREALERQLIVSDSWQNTIKQRITESMQLMKEAA